MVRRLLFVVLLGVLIGAMAAAMLWIAILWVRQPVFSTITSPDGAVSLRLKGYPNRPINPFGTNTVYFDLIRGGQPVAAGRYLYSGEWGEPSYNEFYTQHNWISNSVLRFSRENVSATQCDTLVVKNLTAKPISYLYIKSNDLFIVIGPNPQSDFRICAAPQRSISWVEVEGQFADGTLIPFKGSNFTIDDRPGPFEYRIVIAPDGPQILSSQLAEYDPTS
jgi:hypothetical protein